MENPYLAQYDEFVVMAHIITEIDGEMMIDIADVEKVIEAIETRMAQYLVP